MLVSHTNIGQENSLNPSHWENLENMDQAAKEYLEKSLGFVSIHSGEQNKDVLESAARKNDIWRAIRTFFSERDC